MFAPGQTQPGHGAWNIARRVKGLAPKRNPGACACEGQLLRASGMQIPLHAADLSDAGGRRSRNSLYPATWPGKRDLGPDVEWLKDETLDYRVSGGREAEFTEAIRSYWPELPDNALVADYSGIRPKMVGSGSAAADFVIQTPKDHDVNGLIQLFGIESPGLTASLAIGDLVADHAAEMRRA